MSTILFTTLKILRCSIMDFSRLSNTEMKAILGNNSTILAMLDHKFASVIGLFNSVILDEVWRRSIAQGRRCGVIMYWLEYQLALSLFSQTLRVGEGSAFHHVVMSPDNFFKTDIPMDWMRECFPSCSHVSR